MIYRIVLNTKGCKIILIENVNSHIISNVYVYKMQGMMIRLKSEEIFYTVRLQLRRMIACRFLRE